MLDVVDSVFPLSNINTILDIILHQRLGLDEYNLFYLYPKIHNILLSNTLPIFSQYFPCYRSYIFNPSKNKVAGVADEYYLNIPDIVNNGLQIISVSKVIPTGSLESSPSFDGYKAVNMCIEDFILNAAVSNIASNAKFSFRKTTFIPPNRVRLRGWGTNEITLELKIKYPSFSSIPESVVEQFLNLATADVSIYIYNKLKHFDTIPLPIGNIELKLDQLSNGIAMREDVINLFKTKGYANTAIHHYYTYE